MLSPEGGTIERPKDAKKSPPPVLRHRPRFTSEGAKGTNLDLDLEAERSQFDRPRRPKCQTKRLIEQMDVGVPHRTVARLMSRKYKLGEYADTDLHSLDWGNLVSHCVGSSSGSLL